MDDPILIRYQSRSKIDGNLFVHNRTDQPQRKSYSVIEDISDANLVFKQQYYMRLRKLVYDGVVIKYRRAVAVWKYLATVGPKRQKKGIDICY